MNLLVNSLEGACLYHLLRQQPLMCLHMNLQETWPLCRFKNKSTKRSCCNSSLSFYHFWNQQLPRWSSIYSACLSIFTLQHTHKTPYACFWSKSSLMFWFILLFTGRCMWSTCAKYVFSFRQRNIKVYFFFNLPQGLKLAKTKQTKRQVEFPKGSELALREKPKSLKTKFKCVLWANDGGFLPHGSKWQTPSEATSHPSDESVTDCLKTKQRYLSLVSSRSNTAAAWQNVRVEQPGTGWEEETSVMWLVAWHRGWLPSQWPQLKFHFSPETRSVSYAWFKSRSVPVPVPA